LYNLIILSLFLTLIILPKELTLLDKLYFSVLASCTVISLFNELVLLPFFLKRVAKVRIIFKPPNFSATFFEKYSLFLEKAVF
jgi:hypothetical protein